MSLDPNGARPFCSENQLNLFALVVYIPDPMGRFLDELRRELVPGCVPHAHVSVLPPRPLVAQVEAACEEARVLAAEFTPFEIVAGEIEIFPVTDVIYINVAKGAEELHRMYRALSAGKLTFQEPFPYHPHITLAQELKSDDVQPLFELARRRWREFSGNRSFRAERLAFVQNTARNRWIDLAEFALGVVPSLP